MIFRGMPDWTQAIGNLLPVTHFLILARGILLKGNGWRCCGSLSGRLCYSWSASWRLALKRPEKPWIDGECCLRCQERGVGCFNPKKPAYRCSNSGFFRVKAFHRPDWQTFLDGLDMLEGGGFIRRREQTVGGVRRTFGAIGDALGVGGNAHAAPD